MPAQIPTARRWAAAALAVAVAVGGCAGQNQTPSPAATTTGAAARTTDTPGPAQPQPPPSSGGTGVVVLVNGDPITNLDIEHRTRFLQLATNRTPTRREVIDELIDERLKLQLPKRYDFSTLNIDNEVENAINNMARRRNMTQQQFAQDLAARGVPISTLKSRLKAEFIWAQAVRGRYAASLQLNDSQVLKELELRNKDDPGGYDYTLRPILFVVTRGSPPAVFEGRRREADGLRTRFRNCEEGLPLAQALSGVVVRPQVVRSSADLPPQLREILERTEVGRLTPPETTPEGISTYALCSKKPSSKDNTVGKREVREEIYAKQFQASAKKFIEELRRQAYIQYK
ncbi:MAG TPA: peptidylprolyl isomerase [Xanthobacteraceae bacterium]|nr:peptidylprolyl isomerase [Xanthobacteraceae bacterium]